MFSGFPSLIEFLRLIISLFCWQFAADFRNNGDFYKKCETGRRPTVNNENVKQQQREQQSVYLEEKVEMRRLEMRQPIFVEENTRKQKGQQGAISEEKIHLRRQESEMRKSKPDLISTGQAKSQSILSKQSKPAIAESGPGRPAKISSEQKMCSVVKPKLRQDTAVLQRKLPMVPQDVSLSRHKKPESMPFFSKKSWMPEPLYLLLEIKLFRRSFSSR